MAGEQTTTPPAGGIDTKALGEAIAAALAPSLATAIGEANKPLVEQIKTLQQQPAPQQAATAAAGKPGEAKPLSLDEVGRVVAEQLKGFQQQSQQSAQRESYLAGKLKDLPAAYRNQLGNDPAKWPTEEQAIRDQFKADRQALGVKTDTTVGGDNPGGAKPGETVDLSKLSPVQQIAMGLKDQKPQGPGGTQAGATTTTTAA